jgi:DNA polymerase-1
MASSRSKQGKSAVYLVDGTSTLYRAFFAIRAGLTNKDGMPTNALYGFTNMLRKLIKEKQPEYLAVAFDRPEKTFRHEQYEPYKAQRPDTPPDLVAQAPWALKICGVLGLPSLEKAGYEADDILATLAVRCREAGLDVVVVASDKDLLQLVGDGIVVMNPHKELLLDAAKVEEVFGVRPEQVADVLALWGDASDNVPGVTGIGEKGAKQIIRDFGDLESAIAGADAIKRKSYRENLKAEADQARLSRELVTLKMDVPLDLEPEALRRRDPDGAATLALFQELGFRTLLEDFLPEPDAPETEYAAILEADALESLAKQLRAAGTFALDLCTSSREPMRGELVGLSFSPQAGSGFYVPVGHHYMGMPEQIPLPEAMAILRPLLEDASVGKVGHDLKHTRIVLERAGVKLQGITFDTMIASYLIDPIAKHGLEDLAAEHLGTRTLRYEDVAGKGAKQRPAAELEVEELRDYGAACADLTWQLSELLAPRLEESGQRRLLEEMELPLLEVLAGMERAGVQIDVGYLGKMSREFQKELDRLQGEIFELAGHEFNIQSPRQLATILFDELGLESTRKTAKTKSRSTGQEALEELAAEHDVPRLVLEYRGLSKLKSTYVDALPALVHPDTGRLHTSFNQAVAATGRLSSSDPNLQNIPVRTEQGRRIRRAFVTAPGCRLVVADYSQVELRILAHMTGDPSLLEAFRRGEDIHATTAAKVFGVPLEQVSGEMRSRSKAVNFGILYGMGPHRLARSQSMTFQEAKQFIADYFLHFVGVKEYIERVSEEAKESGKVSTLFGRVRYLPDIQSSNRVAREAAMRAAVNTTIQGTAADLIKMAMVNVDRELRRQDLKARMILQVHDELVLEAPEKEVPAVQELLVACMEGAHKLDAPLVVDTGVGDNWLEAK